MNDFEGVGPAIGYMFILMVMLPGLVLLVMWLWNNL